MEYPSYTNDSDSQFAAQIDRYKLGPGVSPGGDMFSASEAMLASLGNNPMNVAALLKARSSLHSDSMDTRKAVSVDRMAGKAYDELEKFSSRMRDEYDPKNPEKNARTAAEGASMYSHNPDVLNAASNFNSVVSGVFRAKQDASRSKDVDSWEAEREQREKLNRLQTDSAFASIDRNNRLLREGDMGDENKKTEAWGAMLHGIKSLKTPEANEVALALNSAWTKLNFDGDVETKNEFHYLAESFSKASAYEAVSSDGIADAKEVKNKLKVGAGVDLDAARTPEEKAVALAKANEWITSQYPTNTSNEELNKKNRRSVAEYEESLNKDAEFAGIYGQRAAMAQAIKQLSDSVPSKDATHDEKRDYRVKLETLKLNLHSFNAEIDSIYSIKKQRMDEDKRYMDLREQYLRNKKLDQDIRLDAMNPGFKEMANDMKLRGFDERRSLAFAKEFIDLKKDKSMIGKSDEEILAIIRTAQKAGDFEDGGIDLAPAK